MLKKKYPIVHTAPQGGFIVRLANTEEKSFLTATKIEENADGSIEIWADRIYRARFVRGTYLSFWPAIPNRDKEMCPRAPANKLTYHSGKRIASKNISKI
jgi:hypothetical protein